MKSLTDCFTLNNGVQIPCLGFGTWQAPDGPTAVEAVRVALDAGYRHIDTAAGYQNEGSVGAAVRESGLAREDLFITSKLQNSVRGYEETLKAFDASMDKLGMEYMDLYLIHWPAPLAYRDNWKAHNAETWRAMEDLYKQKRIRAIGISNFMPHHIEALMETATITPAVNQIRLCPGDVHAPVVEDCQKRGILLEAYSPLGTGMIFDVPEMKAFAEKYQRSIAQICLRWSLQMGFLPLPKSVTAQRIQENGRVFDFELSAEDVETITNLEGCVGVFKDPDNVPF